MGDFQLQNISLVMLGVADLKRSLHFYRDRLGLAVQSEIPGFAFLACGGVTLALSEPLAKAASAGGGAAEIVFSVDGVREACEALRAQGIAFDNEPRSVADSMWAANFHDPDGHLLSIFGPEKKDPR